MLFTILFVLFFFSFSASSASSSLIISPRNGEHYDSPIPIKLRAPTGSVVCMSDLCDANICTMLHKPGTMNATGEVSFKQCFEVQSETGELSFRAQLASGCCMFKAGVFPGKDRVKEEHLVVNEEVLFDVDFVDKDARELGSAVPLYSSWGNLRLREDVPFTQFIGECALLDTATALVTIREGLHLEFGTGDAHTTRCLARAGGVPGLERPWIHSFDSFLGFQEDWRPGHPRGKWSTDGVLPTFFREDYVVLHPGLFNDTLPAFVRVHLRYDPVAFVLLDVGPAGPSLFAMRQIACALRVGTIIVSANYYNFRDWKTVGSEAQALDDVASEFGLRYELISRWATWMVLRVTKAAEKGCAAPVPLEKALSALTDTDKADKADYQTWLKLEDMVLEALRQEPLDPVALSQHAAVLFSKRDLAELPKILNATRRHVAVARAPHSPSESGALAQSWFHELRARGMPKFDISSVPMARLWHDRDQMQYLVEHGHRHDESIQGYLRALNAILAERADVGRGDVTKLHWEEWESIGRYFNRALYVPLAPRVAHAVNPHLDFERIQKEYLSASPQVVVVDDFLTPEALEGLSKYYREATIFWDMDHSTYVGSYVADAFLSDLTAQLVEEVAQRFPDIICDHHLNQAWAYKYDDQSEKAINVHADVAAVNFNLWLSPDEACLSPEGSGLVVYENVPPAYWSFKIFNADPTPAPVRKLIKESSTKVIAHKRNRLVLFQSDLFHSSGTDMKWKPGYEGRRINLTLLFGKMRAKCGDNTKFRSGSTTKKDEL